MKLKLKTISSLLMLSSTFVSANEFQQQNNSGMEAVTQAAEQPIVNSIPSETVEFISAEEQLSSYLESKNWNEGWDDNKKRIFVIASESFDVEDPSYDTDFITKRSVYATMAGMAGKAKMVEFMRTQMSAVDQLKAPGTDVYAELNAAYMKATKRLKKQQEEMVDLLSLVDQKEADMLAGVTWDDRSKALFDAAIKKLDASFDTGKIEQEKLNKYEKAKKRYEESATELNRLQAQSKAIKGKVKSETFSSVETLAKAPIMGATVIAQAESWNEEEEQYEVAVLMVWSPKLETSAKSLLTGEKNKVKPKKGMTTTNWIKKQDLSTLVGSRQFIDQNGDRWFVGAFSTYLGNSSSSKRSAKGIADLFAKKEAVMAVFADLETQKQAQIATQTRNAGLGGKDHTTVVHSFAETTRQEIENKQISGLSKLTSRTVTHPISGHKIYTVVYAISPASARSALAMEASNYASAISAEKAQSKQKGLKDAYDASLNKAENNKESYKEGYTQGTATLDPKPKAVEAKKVITTQPKPKVKTGPTKSQAIINAIEIDEEEF